MSVWLRDSSAFTRRTDCFASSVLQALSSPSCGDYGTLAARVRLAPGESRELRFLLAWSKPWRSNTWEISAPGLTDEQIAGIRAQHWKNYYATLFPTSLDTARYALREFDRLRRETELFRSALFGSSLPPEVLDAVSANLAVLKSPTCMSRTA